MSPTLHLLMRLSRDVAEICQPFLVDNQLNAYSFSRIYINGSRTELWTDALALEHAFTPKKKANDKYDTQNHVDEKIQSNTLRFTFFDYPQNTERIKLHELLNQCSYFNEAQCLITADENQHFCDLHIFYAPTNTSIFANAFPDIDLSALRQFAKQFKIDAGSLIQTADAHRILTEYSRQPEVRHFSLEQTRDNSYSSSIKLTKREIEVTNNLLRGKTAFEISEALYISKRTVEHHIENIKGKTQCRNRSELIHFLHNNTHSK